MKISSPIAALHILALSSVAFAQPLYELLARNPEFFVMRQVYTIDLFAVLGLISLGIPLGLHGLVRLLRRPSLMWRGHLILIAIFVTVGLLPIGGKLGSPGKATGWGVLGAAALTAAALAVCYARHGLVRSLLTWLSPSILLVPAAFLWQSDVLRLLSDRDPPTVELIGPIQAQSPIVVIVFDELPLTTLLDEQHEIDAVRYPHFAALAREATWFRNATTNHQNTAYALPAMLTGNITPKQAKGGLADHPFNLFTLLRDHYDFRVFEPYTRLCPPELRWQAPPAATLLERLGPLLEDLGLLQLHLLTPPAWVAGLPDIARLDFPDCCSSPRGKTPRLDQFEQFLQALEATDRPALYFLHNVNPHTPHVNFPSGQKYTDEEGWPEGMDRATKVWGDDEHLIHQAYQRHLLQVGLVDRLLGRALERLKARGLYDQALIIVLADHGVSYWPRLPIRSIDGPNQADIARVPFLVKRPQQRQGRVDDSNVQIVDLLPTIADVQGFAIPWQVRGVSAFAPADQKPAAKWIDCYHPYYLGQGRAELVLPADLDGDFGSVRRKLALFGAGDSRRIFAFGPHPELHGQPAGLWLAEEPANIRVELDPRRSAAADLVPAFFKGTVYLDSADQDRQLAVAVNGTVWATATVRNRGDGVGRLLALVPEECCRSSQNLVEFHAIETRAGQTRLLPTRSRVLVPEEVPLQKEPEPVRLEQLALVPRALQGSLDGVGVQGDQVFFVGWAADVSKDQLARSVMLFMDGKLVSDRPVAMPRPDVMAALGKPALKDAGFRLHIPLSALPKNRRPDFRLVAVGPDGSATELAASGQYKQNLRYILQYRRNP